MMSKFIAYIDETSNGCDYTIACGKILWELAATTKDEALAELRKRIAPPLEDGEGLLEVENVTLYQVENVITVPIEQWYDEREKEEKEYNNARLTDMELSEYDRLKKKYG